MIVAVSGKGGVGKTSLTALIVDELTRFNYPGQILVVDGDPAMTLHLALGLDPPGATVGMVRDRVKLDARTLRSLPAGSSPGRYLLDQLRRQQVVSRHRLRRLKVDYMAMGPGEGPGCYCQVNGALKQALAAVTGAYDLVIVDNEAGLEWVSRYRLERADLFLVVVGPDRASQDVAIRIIATAGQLALEIGQTWLVCNRMPATGPAGEGQAALPPQLTGHQILTVPQSWTISALDRHNRLPLVRLCPTDPVRLALGPVVEKIIRCA